MTISTALTRTRRLQQRQSGCSVGTVGTEKAGLTTTAKDEQKVLTEASNSSDGDSTCYEAEDVVGYDAQDVVEDDTEDVVGYDAG